MANIRNVRVDPADFTRLDPIPQEGIVRAEAIMQSGKLFRYSGNRPEDSEVALLERDFAAYIGTRHALAVSSCTQAIELALLASGVKRGSRVLVPGFTFTAVPSAIVILGATPVFVECNDNYRLDLDDLELKMNEGAEMLLLSHMRGHISDMDAIVPMCEACGVTIVEDAAHALGVTWRERKVGSFGKAGCFSFQSNKIINAGEGGILTTDDDEIFVKATYLSGAYESNYRKHFTHSDLFDTYAGQLPAHNVRMNNLSAAVARPQLALVDQRGARYREMHAYLRTHLTATGAIEFPRTFPQERPVPDSLQFRLLGCDVDQMQAFIARVREDGLPLSGFADANNARAFYNWRYLGKDMPHLPQTRAAIQNVCDMRLSTTLDKTHLDYLIGSVSNALQEVGAMRRPALAP